MQMSFSSSRYDILPLYFQFLLEVARAKNSQPLPLIQEKSGFRLPPDRYCLTGCNYRLKTGSNTQKKVL